MDVENKSVWTSTDTSCLLTAVVDMVCWPSWATDLRICYKKNNKWCWQVLYLFASLSLVNTRPGVLKDLKTMGSVSLFIFFVTLLVLARQVSSFYKPNHLWITTVGEIVIIIDLHIVCTVCTGATFF